ncbi:MAG: VpsR-related response regulator, partial [Azonexus sp.]
MKTRHLLAIDPQGHLSNQPLQMAADDQTVHCVDSVVAAKKVLAKNYCSVGLVVFESLAPTFQDDIELLIAANPSTEWIALVSPKILEAKAFQSFILNAFHDYHTLPIEPQRLAMGIGHACGKARLRLALTNPGNVTGR